MVHEEDLLLRGDIIEEFHIGKEIYECSNQNVEFQSFSSINKKTILIYGKGSQGTFKLILVFPKHASGFCICY